MWDGIYASSRLFCCKLHLCLFFRALDIFARAREMEFYHDHSSLGRDVSFASPFIHGVLCSAVHLFSVFLLGSQHLRSRKGDGVVSLGRDKQKSPRLLSPGALIPLLICSLVFCWSLNIFDHARTEGYYQWFGIYSIISPPSVFICSAFSPPLPHQSLLFHRDNEKEIKFYH